MKQSKSIRKLNRRLADYPVKASAVGDWNGDGGPRHAYTKPGSNKK